MSDRPQPHDLEVTLVSVDAVTPHPKNARRGDVDAIVESMDENGIFAPIVVQRSTGYVIDGNHRLAAMRQLGQTHAPVVYVDVDDEQATRILLAANRTNDLATYDDRLLAELLKDLPSLEGTGYDDDDLTDLLIQLERTSAPVDLGEPARHDVDDEGRVAATGKERHGETGEREYPDDSRTPTAESYAAAATRMMILNYPLDRFAWVQEQLEALSDELGMDANADIIIKLIEDRTGETAPAKDDEE